MNKEKVWSTDKVYSGDFPGGPVVKTLPSNEGGMGSNPSWGVKIPYACHQKIRSNIVINSIKTLKKRKNL